MEHMHQRDDEKQIGEILKEMDGVKINASARW